MRLTQSALIAALVFATIPQAVAAEPEPGLFGYFRSICSDSDPGRGEARALAQGFTPAKKKPKAIGLDDARGFEKEVGERHFFVIVGRGAGKPKDGLPASTTSACGVGFKGKDDAALAAGRKWVGVPVSRSMMGVSFHGFRQSASGRTALPFEDKPALKAALAASDFNILTLSGLGGMTFLMLSRTREAS